MYFNLVKVDENRQIILMVLQNLTLNEKIAEMTSKECSFVSVFVPHLEESKSNELIKSSLQLVSEKKTQKFKI